MCKKKKKFIRCFIEIEILNFIRSEWKKIDPLQCNLIEISFKILILLKSKNFLQNPEIIISPYVYTRLCREKRTTGDISTERIGISWFFFFRDEFFSRDDSA